MIQGMSVEEFIRSRRDARDTIKVVKPKMVRVDVYTYPDPTSEAVQASARANARFIAERVAQRARRQQAMEVRKRIKEIERARK